MHYFPRRSCFFCLKQEESVGIVNITSWFLNIHNSFYTMGPYWPKVSECKPDSNVRPGRRGQCIQLRRIRLTIRWMITIESWSFQLLSVYQSPYLHENLVPGGVGPWEHLVQEHHVSLQGFVPRMSFQENLKSRM